MSTATNRLFFIDAIRAWAILMMLQGHFIDGLLDNSFRLDSNIVFSVWKYFRGITAPVFFTVSGFIFTFLLIKSPLTGVQNPRVKKGIKRGLELLAIGYLLRMNLFGLFKGEIYNSFYLIDVLHCIGLSILFITGLYVLTTKNKSWLLPTLLLTTTLFLFVFEPLYKPLNLSILPQWIANYFTKENGSVFTIIPWLGYTTFGSFASIIFSRFKNHAHIFTWSIAICIASGLSLIFFSSDFFLELGNLTGIDLFKAIFYNNYLFIRLGDVLLVFSIFMIFRKVFTNTTFLALGQSTLSIYVIHFMILYGSLTGLGLYAFLHHSLTPWIVVPGALLFMITCSYLALQYGKNELVIKSRITTTIMYVGVYLEKVMFIILEVTRNFTEKILRLLGLIKNQ